MTQPHRSGLAYRLTLSWLKMPAARNLLEAEARGEYVISYDGKYGHLHCRELADLMLLTSKFSP
jgi:hypothetical protein